MRSLENELQKSLEHLHGLEKETMDGEKALYKASEELKHAKRHMEIVRLEQEQLMGEEIDLDEQITRYNRSLMEIQGKVKSAQEAVTRNTSDIDTVSRDLESYNLKIQDLKLGLTTHQAGIESNNATLRRLREFYADSQKRLETLEQDIRIKMDRKKAAREKLDSAGPRLARMYETVNDLEAKLQINEADYHIIDTEIKKNDDMINDLKTRREEILQKIRLLEIELSQIRIRRDNTAGRLAERYNRSLSQLKTAMAEKTDLMEFFTSLSLAELEAELATHKSKIEKITDVNLGAIKEYEEHKLRHTFLEEQQNDLQNAIDNLHRVIRKINTITQERFIKTFDQINEKLEEVFPRLFNGGSAKLVMTDPADPLETGVEFMVHPPGKKLTRLSLLSGGEKALSAIAFIFSFFLIKPASFCLMDEIDAPLDDANVFRFNDLLKIIGEKSQIIMITHNKRSMEFADSLFGITMEKQGVSKVVSVNFQAASPN
jgi:chromosome segregation protein